MTASRGSGALAGSFAAATAFGRQSRDRCGTVVEWPRQSVILAGLSCPGGVDEQLIDRHAPGNQTLIPGCLFERLDGRAVRFDAVGQRIVTDDLRERGVLLR